MHGELLYPMILKLAAAEHGVIALRPGPAPERQLFQFLGGRVRSDDRLIAAGLRDLAEAGIVDVTSEAITVRGWQRQQSKKPRERDSWPFFRLYVRESGGFALLSYGARALGAQLLRLAGDDGRCHLGAGPSWGHTLVRVRGWGEEGRWARKSGMIDAWIRELVEDGYLIEGVDEHGSHVVIRNYLRAQVIETEEGAQRQPARRAQPVDGLGVTPPAGQRSGSEAVATRERSGSDPVVTRERSGSEGEAKSLELFTPGMLDRSDPSRFDSRDPECGNPGSRGGVDSLSGRGGMAGAEERAAHAVVRRVRKPEHTYDPEFDRAWFEYPTREGDRGPKKAAERKFLALARQRGQTPAVFADVLVADIRQRKRSVPTWLKGSPPDMLTYLNQGRFEDPLPGDGALARQREREAKAKREMAEREARELSFTERVERVALAATDWRGPDRAACWLRPYDGTLSPESQAIWDRVIRMRLKELAGVKYPREDLPLWARQFLDAHPRGPRADGPVRRDGPGRAWGPPLESDAPIPLRPRGEEEVQRIVGALASAKAVPP